VANLTEAAPQGYIGPGQYILPLDRDKGSAFGVTRVPRSPAYVPAFVNVQVYACPPEAVDWAAGLAHEHLGVDKKEARDRLKNLPETLARNVPRDRAVAFMNEFLKKD